MKISNTLKKQIVQAAQTSMRIEGYAPLKSPAIKARAKALMEAQRVQVSVQGK